MRRSRDMLENLEVYRAALERCNSTVEQNNEVNK